ncbi:MAG: MBL fold metallo-hydrolase [Rhodobacter sp.]|nr:MBL fold metallo-hydrolase [Rhodobacter sp.]
MKRRDFMTTAALAGIGVAAGVRVAPVLAQDGTMGVAAAQRFSIGEAVVTAFSDGFLPIGADALIGVTAEEFRTLLQAAYIDAEAHPTGVNAYLVETGDSTVLVDAGTGAVFGPGLGHLAANMAALGVDPGAIDTLVATHLHPDHIGGVVTEAGNPFANATLKVSDTDLGFWTSEDVKAQAPEEVRQFFDLAMAAVAAFGDRVEGFTGAAALGPGLSAMPLPGHTPGHSGVMLESGGDALLIWGDIVHVPPVQFARPEVTIGFDVDQDMARATRAKVLDMAATDRLRVAGMHIGFPGLGHLEKAGSGYRFVPSLWQYG